MTLRPAVTVLCCASIALAVSVMSYRAAHAPAVPGPDHVFAGPPDLVDTEALLLEVADVRAGGAASISLTGMEVTALVSEGLPGLIPAGVVAPRVEIVDGRLSIYALVVAEDFPGAGELGAVVAALPDTAAVALAGRLVTRGDGWVSYRVDYASVEGVPVPLPVVRSVLAKAPVGAGPASRRGDAPSEGVPAVRIRLPRGVGAVYAISDRVVVERAEPIVDIVVDQDSP